MWEQISGNLSWHERQATLYYITKYVALVPMQHTRNAKYICILPSSNNQLKGGQF